VPRSKIVGGAQVEEVMMVVVRMYYWERWKWNFVRAALREERAMATSRRIEMRVHEESVKELKGSASSHGSIWPVNLNRMNKNAEM
jgi:hypothetical protein